MDKAFAAIDEVNGEKGKMQTGIPAAYAHKPPDTRVWREAASQDSRREQPQTKNKIINCAVSTRRNIVSGYTVA